MLTVQTLMQEAQVIPRARGRGRAVSRKEEREFMARAIETLPEYPRLILSLRYYESLRPSQIARAFGIEESEVCRVLFQALQLVHASVADAKATPGAPGEPVPRLPAEGRGTTQRPERTREAGARKRSR